MARRSSSLTRALADRSPFVSSTYSLISALRVKLLANLIVNLVSLYTVGYARFSARTTVQQFKEGLARVLQFCFEARRAVAISAGPGLGAVLVAAFAPVVGVLHLHQLKILLPVRTLFLQRCGAITDFDPAHRLVGTSPSLIHVPQVFAPGN